MRSNRLLLLLILAMGGCTNADRLIETHDIPVQEMKDLEKPPPPVPLPRPRPRSLFKNIDELDLKSDQ